MKRRRNQIRVSRKFSWGSARARLALSVVGGTAILGIVGWAVYSHPRLGVARHPLPSGVTFNRDIAPIVFKHCAPCHRAGQAAPFSLLSYTDARKHSRAMLEVTEKRFMPPWPPEPGYGVFANERVLNGNELELLQEWVKEGMVEGHAADLPPAPRWTDGWQRGKPDLVVRMPRPYTMAPDGKDVYRNFVIPLPITSTRYVKEVELLPDNPRPLHHAFMRVDPTPSSRQLDGHEAQPGFSFMMTPDSAQIPEGHFLSWVPGKAFSPEPDDLAWRLEPGTDLVLQMHLRATGRTETVQPQIGFYFTDHPPTQHPIKLLLTSRAIDIPAGDSNYAVEDAFVLPVDLEVLAVLPHAHYLGREMQAVATLPDGTRRWLLWIKHWDFNWQSDYRYAQPVPVPKGTTLSMRFTYDNSTNNVRNPNRPSKEVIYGPQTTDEMAELWLQVLPRHEREAPLLTKALQAHTLKIWFDQYTASVQRQPANAAAHNGLGKALLGMGRNAEALQEFRQAVELNPNLEEPYFYLGYLYRHQKLLAESQLAYENVIRINPTNHEAHGNLGLVFLERGALTEAEAEFRAALQLSPDDAVARQNLDYLLNARGRKRTRN